MSNLDHPGIAARLRFQAAMAKIQPGRQLVSRRTWTILKSTRYDTSVTLLLGCGLRTLSVIVPICHTGPDLAACGLRAVG